MKLGRNDLAGKTGTTNDFIDAWFCGFNPTLVGDRLDRLRPAADARPQRDRRRAALPIWMGYMAQRAERCAGAAVHAAARASSRCDVNPRPGCARPRARRRSSSTSTRSSCRPKAAAAARQPARRRAPARGSAQPAFLKRRHGRKTSRRATTSAAASRTSPRASWPRTASRTTRAAKRKAARQAGVPDTRQLPTNDEIDAALRVHQALYGGDEHRERLRELRERALGVMRELERFNPYLTGSVLTGNAGKYADINLQLYTDNAKARRALPDRQRHPVSTRAAQAVHAAKRCAPCRHITVDDDGHRDRARRARAATICARPVQDDAGRQADRARAPRRRSRRCSRRPEASAFSCALEAAARRVEREVGEDAVGAGALEREQRFHHARALRRASRSAPRPCSIAYSPLTW